MTKSTITREQLLEIIETDHVQCGEASYLARMALAVMDSEPVAVVEPSDYVTADQLVGEGPARKAVHELYEGALRIGDKLYRHAQPAPECQHQWRHGGANELQNQKQCIKCGRVDLDAQQPAPVVPEDVRQALSQMDDEIIAELDAEESACRAATLQAGNSPAQSDCCPAQNHASPEQNGDTPAQSQGWIPVSERMPDCWCRTCRPVVLNDVRFVVCPDCGNKRCPRANDHRNACTGSNEPGQEGSAYPADPQEVKGE
ncbi:hypothetical protein [Klebsiella variicola]|uniref:hypothetical protein n=1 Tax=Klebsiella variicola TaxID=244366 RepID=UPI00188E8D29|nr:hypothetical protein [Klebsiella variicola]